MRYRKIEGIGIELIAENDDEIEDLETLDMHLRKNSGESIRRELIRIGASQKGDRVESLTVKFNQRTLRRVRKGRQ